jgi:hypothetical protein
MDINDVLDQALEVHPVLLGIGFVCLAVPAVAMIVHVAARRARLRRIEPRCAVPTGLSIFSALQVAGVAPGIALRSSRDYVVVLVRLATAGKIRIVRDGEVPKMFRPEGFYGITAVNRDPAGLTPDEVDALAVFAALPPGYTVWIRRRISEDERTGPVPSSWLFPPGLIAALDRYTGQDAAKVRRPVDGKPLVRMGPERPMMWLAIAGVVLTVVGTGFSSGWVTGVALIGGATVGVVFIMTVTAVLPPTAVTAHGREVRDQLIGLQRFLSSSDPHQFRAVLADGGGLAAAESLLPFVALFHANEAISTAAAQAYCTWLEGEYGSSPPAWLTSSSGGADGPHGFAEQFMALLGELSVN